MAKWTLVLCALLILAGQALAKRGGSGSSSRRSSKSKSGSSSSVPANSYPKQQWAPKDQNGSPGGQKQPSAPPGYPGNQNPSYPPYPGQQQHSGYPNQAPPAYPGYPGAPPSYSAPGQAYQAPPAYPGHGYPGQGYPGQGYPGQGYPTGHGYPSLPQHGAVPVPGSTGHLKPSKSKSGVGTHLAAGAAGAVAGAVLAKSIKGPKLRIGMGGHYHGGYYHDGYSSSEEFFEPYMTNSRHRFRDPANPDRVLTQDELQLIRLSRLIERLCEKLSQPSVCTLLKMYGLAPLTDPNSFNASAHFPTNMTAFEENHLAFLQNRTVQPQEAVTPPPQENKLIPIAFEGHVSTTPSSVKEETSSQGPVLSEDRLKAAENLFAALE